MSDLISRSELIKVLKDRSTNEAIMGYMTAYDVTNSIIDEVEEQPTAYDIGKVVEELEKIRAKKTCNKEKCDTKEICRICVVDDAIEIVKHGGVSDDVCEWKQTSAARYKTRCGYKLEEYFDTKACYCKQCGKRIKVVE